MTSTLHLVKETLRPTDMYMYVVCICMHEKLGSISSKIRLMLCIPGCRVPRYRCDAAPGFDTTGTGMGTRSFQLACTAISDVALHVGRGPDARGRHTDARPYGATPHPGLCPQQVCIDPVIGSKAHASTYLALDDLVSARHMRTSKKQKQKVACRYVFCRHHAGLWGPCDGTVTLNCGLCGSKIYLQSNLSISEPGQVCISIACLLTCGKGQVPGRHGAISCGSGRL